MAEYIEREALQKRLELHQATNPETIGKKQFQEGYYLGLSEAEIMVAQAQKADVAPVRRELREAVKLLEKYYEKGLSSDYVRSPVAWALHQAWKEIDTKKQNGEEATCGSCKHFNYIEGTRRGTCDIQPLIKNRWGQVQPERGTFTPAQSRKGCRQYARKESGGADNDQD